MNTKELKEFFEAEGFNVHLFEQGGIQNAEIEKWTDGGVDMVIVLQPFDVSAFKEYVNDFDVDEEIDMHRQDKMYKDNFTIRQSLEDFTDFHKGLIEVSNKLN